MAWKKNTSGLSTVSFVKPRFLLPYATLPNNSPYLSSAGGPPDQIQAWMRALGWVSPYGNVWKANLNQLHCVAARKADLEKLKRWAVPEKMRSCGAIEMHEPVLLLGQ